ncbi:MAG TPA: ribosome-associated translation inhibitor RaiA [Candidatus Paceibacterota bacterium]|jgi:putative sigma-54 modulation protein|nr:ribosome-associated translation inhibitor RaiA [Candidatus Paceibacterota bacterium]
MNYNIKGTHLNISDELRSYVEKKLAHADRLVGDDPTAHADVELQYLEDGRSGKYRAEFTVSAKSELYRADCWGATMHEALDLAGGELVEELSRDKKKKQSVLRRTSIKVKEYLRGWRNEV